MLIRNTKNSDLTFAFRKHLDSFYDLSETQRENLLKKLRGEARSISEKAVKHYLRNQRDKQIKQITLLGIMKKNGIPVDSLIPASSESIVPYLLFNQLDDGNKISNH